jgi:hypothetical protein
MIKEIKWAYQRVVRGYDERCFWGFDSYFIRILPALKEFCEKKLDDKNFVKYNPEKAEVFKTMTGWINEQLIKLKSSVFPILAIALSFFKGICLTAFHYL